MYLETRGILKNNILIYMLIIIIASNVIISETLAKTTADFIERAGYPVEKHNVTTEDGYVLALHRIPSSVHDNDVRTFDKRVVLLMHGFVSSSADFVLMGPNKSMAFYLSDNNYDVWLGDSRGNKYSRRHLTLNPDTDPEYWDFSWHEIGTRDLPTIIDYILNVTGQDRLDYVGHSQGTTAFFVMASTRPEYNHKIRSMHALAPTAFISKIKSPILKWSWNLLETIQATENNTMEVMSYKGRIGTMMRAFCGISGFSKKMCLRITFDMVGENYKQFDLAILPLIFQNSPAGASTKQFLHYWQIYNNGKFNMYDHGAKKNKLIYGEEIPPDYELKNIDLKIFFYCALNDYMTDYEEIVKLASGFGQFPEMYNVTDPKFNHLDFLWAKDLKELISKQVLSNLNKVE